MVLEIELGVMARWWAVEEYMKPGKRYLVTGYDGTTATGTYINTEFDEDAEEADIRLKELVSDDYQLDPGVTVFRWGTTTIASIEEIN